MQKRTLDKLNEKVEEFEIDSKSLKGSYLEQCIKNRMFMKLEQIEDKLRRINQIEMEIDENKQYIEKEIKKWRD